MNDKNEHESNPSNPDQQHDHASSHDHQHNHASGHDHQHDHGSHHAMMIRDFRKRFWISLAITLPVLILSPMIQGIFGYELTFNYSDYILFALSGSIFFYGGWPFLTGLVDEIKEKQPGMMTK